jgi:hypothetical protein
MIPSVCQNISKPCQAFKITPYIQVHVMAIELLEIISKQDPVINKSNIKKMESGYNIWK